MKTLPGEEIIANSNKNIVVLSNQRIQMTWKEWGRSYYNCIFLEDISSVEVRYRSRIIFLVLMILCFLFSIWVFMINNYHGELRPEASTVLVGGIGLGLLFFLLWRLSRKHVISISPNGGSVMDIDVKGMNHKYIEDFTDKILQTKLERVQQINKI